LHSEVPLDSFACYFPCLFRAHQGRCGSQGLLTEPDNA
jgi:hypothetical protein